MAGKEFKITVDEMTDWQSNLRTLGASTGNKRLYITGHGNWIVEIGGVQEYWGQDIERAVKIFNGEQL